MSDGVGALNVLEAARLLNKRKPVKVYQASSSEMFGMVLETPQSEKTPFNPQSPYACSKVYAYFSDDQLPAQLQSLRVQRKFVQSRIAPSG